jgi:hypothetical protein
MVEGSFYLLHVGRVIVSNVDLSFRLTGLGGVGDEAQPGVRREGSWAELN